MSTNRRRSVAGPRDKVTLNPEREAEDQRDADAILQESLLREQLEQVWYCTLHNGEALKTEKCDVARFRLFVEASGFTTTDRQMNVALRNFGMQADDNDKLSLTGLVKVLLHIAADRFAMPTDRVGAVKKFVFSFALPYVEKYRAANAHDGTGSDDTLLNIPEIDRLLYVYDAVFERIFLKYRDVDHHQTRELTLEQVKILDQFLEMDEMKEMLKDFGIFPRLVSFVDMSKACQYACFGRLVMDPTKQGPGRMSSIEVAKSSAGQVGVNVTTASDANSMAAGGSSVSAINALHIPQLPQELQANEVLLDKPRFMSCMLRISQVMYNKPEYQKTLPSIVSRVEEMLKHMSPVYEKMFSKTMESDCDFTEKGVPLLNNVSLSSALSPSQGPIGGGFEITITGSNFCEKRGVFVRFGAASNVVVRAKSIQKKKIIVDAPAMLPEDVEVEVDFQHGEYRVYIQKIVKVAVECSNNRWQYSETDPSQYFTFRDQPMMWTLGAEISARLMKLFGAICAMGTEKQHNKLMSRDKWKEFKRIAELSEVVRRSGTIGDGGGQGSLSGSMRDASEQRSPRQQSKRSHNNDSSVSNNEDGDRTTVQQEDNDVFFLEMAEYHDGEHELTLSFKGFLRVLSRALYEMYGEVRWRDHMDDMADISLNVQRRIVQQAPVMEQNELVLARRAISMVERRSVLELDVFMGPVLCGVLRSRPGDVTSSFSGSVIAHMKMHPFLSYDHLEINTEACVLRHLQLSQSIAHFLQRLRKDGFDLAAHHPKPTTRKPAGRCWGLYFGDVQIGAIWDYEGNYSCLEWQPAERELYHASITMTMYKEEKSTDFIACYLHFTKAKDIIQLRTGLESKGFVLKTKLYRVP